MHFRFVFKEIVHSKGQAWIFVLCVALSLINIVAVNSFRRDIHHSLQSDARQLHGGDIIVRSQHRFSPRLDEELQKYFLRKDLTGNRNWEFYSVARSGDGTRSVLANIKVVDNNYPLYGEVRLRSGASLQATLLPGKVIVAENLLRRLELEVGKKIALGNLSLEIADVVESESQRPVNFFEFGPRILVASADLNDLGLVQHGSRVQYEVLFKVGDQEKLTELTKNLQEKVLTGQEKVTTYQTAESRIKRVFDNLLFFLSLISIFTMLLAGLGMQSGLSAMLRRKEKNIAILKSIGAANSFLRNHYMLLTLILAIVGCTIGVAFGLLVKQSYLGLFAGFLPDNISLRFTVIDMAEGFLLGLVVTGFFTIIPLSSILYVKPVLLFRREKKNQKRRRALFIPLLCGTLLILGLLVNQLNDLKVALYFIAASVGLVIVMVCLVRLFLIFVPALIRLSVTFRFIGRLTFRQAAKSLIRPGNASLPIMVTLASAVAVLLTIELVQSNLQKTYIQSYPEDAPNLFCLDIQKDQQQGFLEMTGEEIELFPVIRARLAAINNVKVDPKKESQRRGDSLAREFNLTYRTELLKDEILEAGESLFGGGSFEEAKGEIPVSVLDSIARIGKIEVGDLLDFNIQGVPLAAKVTSIRARTESMLYPFFYFVFPPKYLRSAPQTFFAALHVEEGEVAELENSIVNRFPNISTINVGETAKEMGRLMSKVGRIVDFFAFFSIIAGGLILVSSILATRIARAQEAVYYKIMGAKSSFVLLVFMFENLMLAIVSSICAVLVAQCASWGLSHYLLDVEHSLNWSACVAAFGLTGFFVLFLGLLSSMQIVNQKPVQLLREQD